MFHSSTCAPVATPSTVTVQPWEPRAPCGSRDGRWVSWVKGFLGRGALGAPSTALARVCSDFPARGSFPPLLVNLHREDERQRGGGGRVWEARDRRPCVIAGPHLRVPNHARGQAIVSVRRTAGRHWLRRGVSRSARGLARRFAASTGLVQVPFVTEPRGHVYFKTV